MDDSHAEDSDLDAKDSHIDSNDAEDVDIEQSDVGDSSNTEDSSNARDSSDAKDSSNTRDNSNAKDSGEESDADANPASSQEATSCEKHLRSLVHDYVVVLGPTVADTLTACKAKDIQNLWKQLQICTLSTDIIIEYNVAPGFAFYNA